MLGAQRCLTGGGSNRTTQCQRTIDPSVCSTSYSRPPPARASPLGKRDFAQRISSPTPSLTVCRSTTKPSSDSSNTEPSVSTTSSAPWSEEDLRQLSADISKEKEEALGQQWRSMFMHDPSSLFLYAQWEAMNWAGEQITHTESNFTPTLANEFIGLGAWRLKGSMDKAIAYMVQRIEGTWRELFTEDLRIYPREKWKHMYDICDSMDPKRELNGWSYGDIPCPEKGEEGYPRLVLENRIYSSRVFRKLHIEVGWRQDGLQVLHVVLFPRYDMDLPILAMDLVVSKDRVTLAIVDACPVSEDLSLPEHYLKTMHELQDLFLNESDGNQRRIPEWGTRIFSKACICIRPQHDEDVTGFIAYAVALHRAHCMLANMIAPVTDEKKLQELLNGHKRFIDNQLSNKATSAVLEQAYGAEWTHAYMHDIMFDFTPNEQPPHEDMSIVRLYNYFELYPEMGTGPYEMMELEKEVALDRAEETLGRMFAGEPVRQDQAEDALKVMYVCDDSFRDSCLQLVPELAALPPKAVGAVLTQNMEKLGLGTPIPRWTTKKGVPGGGVVGQGQ